MNGSSLSIPDVVLIESRIFEDDRGLFFESYNQYQFKAAIDRDITFVQDNHSRSQQGVLRGLHYQIPPKAQGKLVRVVVGEVFDVVVDIRSGSPTFGKWVGTILSEENMNQLWIPEGFAHGFLVLSELAVFLYKATNYYSPDDERCILWDDPDIGIQWPIDVPPILSANDLAGSKLTNAEVFK